MGFCAFISFFRAIIRPLLSHSLSYTEDTKCFCDSLSSAGLAYDTPRPDAVLHIPTESTSFAAKVVPVACFNSHAGVEFYEIFRCPVVLVSTDCLPFAGVALPCQPTPVPDTPL